MSIVVQITSAVTKVINATLPSTYCAYDEEQINSTKKLFALQLYKIT